MRRVIAAFAAACAIALSAAPAFAAGAVHYSFSAIGGICGDKYLLTSGTIDVVMHEGTSASGNLNITGTFTPNHVEAVDTVGNLYSIVGAVWFGGSINSNSGTGPSTDTVKLQIVSQGGGTVDSVNLVLHFSPNGDVNLFDFGTCGF
jgi:hypothetical protein